MTLNQRLILLLLSGFTVTSVTSLCVLSEDMTRCVCNVMDIRNPQSHICFPTSELELRDGKLDVSEVALTNPEFAIQLLQINKLIFNNVNVSFSTVIPFLPLLEFINIIPSTLEDVLFITSQITVDPSFLHPSFQALHQWLFGSLKSLGLVRSGLVEIDSNWAQRVESLTHLDLSENPISYTSLQNISLCSSLSFKSLKSLHLRDSGLTSLQSLCTPLSLTPVLTELDVSRNNFSVFHYPRCLRVKPLRMLNLSHSGITDVSSSLSAPLEELDLSHNSLEVFNNPPDTLKKLYLSNNRLIRLPSLDNLSHLRELKVDGNQLGILINETGASLSTLERLHVLRAGRNPYHCDCALKETIIFLENADSVSVEDFPGDFLCATPVAQQGTQIMTLSLETCVKPTSGTLHQTIQDNTDSVSVEDLTEAFLCTTPVAQTSGTPPHGPPLCLTLFTGLLSGLIYFC